MVQRKRQRVGVGELACLQQPRCIHPAVVQQAERIRPELMPRVADQCAGCSRAPDPPVLPSPSRAAGAGRCDGQPSNVPSWSLVLVPPGSSSLITAPRRCAAAGPAPGPLPARHRRAAGWCASDVVASSISLRGWSWCSCCVDAQRPGAFRAAGGTAQASNLHHGRSRPW